MMRIALISDLHGNEVALGAVLDDIAKKGVDQIVCLGDTATLGPRPSAILAKLRDLGCPCIMGNHDEFLLDAELIQQYTEAPIVVESVDWCRDRMSQDELDFIRTFRPSMEIELGDKAKLLLFHGSPTSHMQDILATTPPDELDEILAGHSATVMAGGHTHIQMLRQHKGMLLVNPGSLGMPFEEYAAGGPPVVMAHTEYATVEEDNGAITVHLHRIPLDKKDLRAALQGCDNPLTPALMRHYS